MKIDFIELFHVGSPDAHEFRDGILARLVSGELSGWGEAGVAAAPFDCDQWAAGTFAFLEHCLAPEFVGRLIDSADALGERMNRFRGHSLAKGAVDCAWRDLTARIEGQPLWRALGGKERAVTVARPHGPSASIDELLAEISGLVERDTSYVTLKLRPGWGVDVVRAVRGEFASLGIRVDFDGTATLDQRDLLFRLQDFHVTAIEQPLDADDLVGHAMLQEALDTPICLDQSITSAARARMALDVGSCRQVRVSPDYCGGLTAALDIIAACRESDATCVVGCRTRGDVGTRHAAALAMLDGAAAEIELDDGGLREEVEVPDRVDAWSEPGIGVECYLQELRTNAVAHRRIEPK